MNNLMTSSKLENFNGMGGRERGRERQRRSGGGVKKKRTWTRDSLSQHLIKHALFQTHSEYNGGGAKKYMKLLQQDYKNELVAFTRNSLIMTWLTNLITFPEKLLSFHFVMGNMFQFSQTIKLDGGDVKVEYERGRGRMVTYKQRFHYNDIILVTLNVPSKYLLQLFINSARERIFFIDYISLLNFG